MTLIISSFFLIQGSVCAQPSIEITAIGGNGHVGSDSIWVDKTERVEGRLIDATGVKRILIAVRRVGEEEWRIRGNTMVDASRSKSAGMDWSIDGVMFGKDSHCGQPFDLMAIVPKNSNSLSREVFDEATLLNRAQVCSEQVRVSRNYHNEVVAPRDTFGIYYKNRIEIIFVGGTKISKVKPPIETPIMIQGDVEMNCDYHIYVIVRPKGSDRMWVVDEGMVNCNNVGLDLAWSGVIPRLCDYGLEEWREFIVKVVISEQFLSEGEIGSIMMIEESEEIEVVREKLCIKPDIKVFIEKVDHQRVKAPSNGEKLKINHHSEIKGTIQIRPLEEGERILVYKNVVASKGDEWLLLGQANIEEEKDGLSWKLTSRHLGDPDEHLKIIAIVVDGKKREKTISPEVEVIITEDLNVCITEVGSDKTSDYSAEEVCHIVDVKGELTGRRLKENEVVMLLKKPLGDYEDWDVVGEAKLKPDKNYWALPPIYLGEPRDKFYLVAIVGEGGSNYKNLNGKGVIVFSDAVQVSLKDCLEKEESILGLNN
jgi:hypothetical protein